MPPGTKHDSGLHIAIIGPAYPYRGGIAHFTNRWYQELARRHHVSVYTFSRQYPSVLFPGKSQTEDGNWDLPAGPARIIDSVRPATWKRAGRAIAEAEPDVVVCCYWLPFFVPAYLGVLRAYRKHARNHAQIVLLLHNVAPHGRFPFGNRLFKRLTKACDGFVTLSADSTAELKPRAPNARILTAFHPIYDIFDAPVPPHIARDTLNLPEKDTLLFFGLVRRYKGLDVLIEAMPAILEKHDVQLLVAGEFYDDEEMIRKRIKELKLEPHVRLENEYIPNERVHLYYSAADLVVQPYRSATQSGVSNIALFFRKPIVVTNVGGLPETVPDGKAGFIAVPDDHEALALAVHRFFESDRTMLTRGAAEQASKLSWKRFTNLFDRFVAHAG